MAAAGALVLAVLAVLMALQHLLWLQRRQLSR